MTVVSEQVGDSNLEGLVLRDGAGAFYEVPCVVIERYRVPVERAVELLHEAADDPARFAMPHWVVHGGIYAATESARSVLYRCQ